MKKKRAAAAVKVQAEEKKQKIVVKHETSDDEEEESEEGSEEETQEIEESEPEEINEDDEEEEEEEEEVEEEEEIEEEVEEEEEEEDDEDEDEDEDEDDESSKKEILRKLLEPLPKDKIIEFLKEAAMNDHSIVASLTKTAEVDPTHRKIFVFGLGWDATSDQVLSVFKQYGDIEECKVVTDKVTGKAKGYGFVLFKTRKSAQKALKKPQKKIGSRMASCQLASAGPGVPSHSQTAAAPDHTSPNGRKIFVANVGSHVNPNALRSFFSKFGEIEEGPLGMDKATGKFKGYAMFIYKTGEGCKKVLEEPAKVFDGCQLQCRQAVDGQRGNKLTKNLPSGNSSTEIGNLGYGYGYGYGGVYGGQIINPAAAGIMVGQNPMLVSALNQNTTPQSFGVSGGYGLNPTMMANYGSQLGLAGLGPYQNQNQQVGRSTAGTASTQAGRQQTGLGSYLGR